MTIECSKARTGAAIGEREADDALADLRFIGYDAQHSDSILDYEVTRDV